MTILGGIHKLCDSHHPGLMACPPIETKSQTEVQFAQPLDADDITSEYFSLDGSSSLSLCRSRRHSLALSADFMSCLDEDEEEEEDNERLTMGALGEEGGSLVSYDRWPSIEDDLDGVQSSNGVFSKSWSGLSWMMHSCCPSNVPLIGRLYSSQEDSSWYGSQPHDCSLCRPAYLTACIVVTCAA